MRRTMVAAMTAVLLIAVVGVAFAQEAQPERRAAAELTADELAVLEQANDLQKQLEISRLELRISELKDAPQGEIADRAAHMYRLQGELHALRVKHPAVAKHQRREQARERRGRGFGRAQGEGQAWGQGRRARGQGQGMGRGRGQGAAGWGQGQGMGRGRGHGRGGWDRGPGMGRAHGGEWHEGGPGMGRGGGRGMGPGGGSGMGHGGGRWVPMGGPELEPIPPARNVDVSTVGLELQTPEQAG